MAKEQAIKHLKLMQSGARNAIRFTKNDKEISEEERKEDIEIYQDQLEALEIATKALEQQPTTQEILSHIETGITATGQSDSYCVGFCNALIWLKSCITHEEPQFFEDRRGNENGSN